MENHGMYDPTRLESPHFHAPLDTYTRLMKSSTRLHPDRQQYVTERMVNSIEGASMRKEWSGMDKSMKQYMDTYTSVGLEAKKSIKQQKLNMQCGHLYL